MGCLSIRTIDESKKIITVNQNLKKRIIFNEEQKLQLGIYALINNLETKHSNSEIIKEKIEKVFKNLPEKKEKDIKQEEMIQNISNIFIDYLKPISAHNQMMIKNLINTIYSKNKNINNFKQYLIKIYEDINDYKNLKEEEKISNFIIKSLGKNDNIMNFKFELEKEYNYNNFIRYEDFARIIKLNEIVLEPIIMHYLLYKMKYGLSLDEDLSLYDLDIKILLYYLDKIKKDLNDNNTEKGSIGEKNDD